MMRMCLVAVIVTALSGEQQGRSMRVPSRSRR